MRRTLAALALAGLGLGPATANACTCCGCSCELPVIDAKQHATIEATHGKVKEIRSTWEAIARALDANRRHTGDFAEATGQRLVAYPGGAGQGSCEEDPAYWTDNAALAALKGTSQGATQPWGKRRRALGLVGDGHHPSAVEDVDRPLPGDDFAQRRLPPALRTAVDYANAEREREGLVPPSTWTTDDLEELTAHEEQWREDLEQAIGDAVLVDASDEVEEATRWLDAHRRDARQVHRWANDLEERRGDGDALARQARAQRACPDAGDELQSALGIEDAHRCKGRWEDAAKRNFGAGLITYVEDEEKKTLTYDREDSHDRALDDYLKEHEAKDLRNAIAGRQATGDGGGGYTDAKPAATRDEHAFTDSTRIRRAQSDANRRAILASVRSRLRLEAAIEGAAFGTASREHAARNADAADAIAQRATKCRTLVCETATHAEATRLGAGIARTRALVAVHRLWLAIMQMNEANELEQTE